MPFDERAGYAGSGSPDMVEQSTNYAGAPYGNSGANYADEQPRLGIPREPDEPETPEEEDFERKKDLRIVIVWAIVVMAMIAAFLVYQKTKKLKVELNDYVTVSVNGYNTVGTAEAVFDIDQFVEDYGSVITRKNGGVTTDSAGNAQTAAAELAAKYISGSLDRNSALSNGDTVTYVWNCDDTAADDQFRCKLIYSNISTEVAALPDPEPIDLFTNVSVSFSGFNGQGTAALETASAEDVYANLTYTVEPSEGLSNGDTVTVRVSDNNGLDITTDYVAAYGKIVSETERTMTVEGLTTYVTRAEDLADGVVETLNEKSRGVFETEESSTWTDGTELMDFSYAGGYLLTDGSASDASGETEGFTGTDDLFDMGSDVENLLYLVYEVRVQLPENASAGNGTDWFGWGSGYQSLFGTDNDTDNETGGNAEYGTANDAYDDSEDSDAVDEERVKTYYYPVLYRNVMADGSNVYDAGALSYELPGRSTFLGFDTSDQVSFRYGSRTYKYHGFKTLEAAEKSCRDAYDYLYEIETL